MIALKPTVVLAVALGVSALANAALGWAWLDQREQTAVQAERVKAVVKERNVALDAARECSESVAYLAEVAEEREREAEEARQRAAQAAASHERRADKQLSTPPAVPGNDCASAKVRVDNWLKGRKQ